ncbi:Gag protease polyprotein [Gossypium australe]|uniref:Gag protease polyprotein n=1 Tax=Gossypium australe TaxID=47621 RepID=A0A5B6WQW0_9ROSI|nr:Gag protease polyprotein [Gossypium australe]
MDFVSRLPLSTLKKNSVLVIVDRLTKSAHFVVSAYMASLHPSRSKVYFELQESLGTKLWFSTTFHLQTDGQSERVIQVLEDMLRSCVIDFRLSSPTTIATTPVLVCLLLRLYMGEYADPQSVRWSLRKENLVARFGSRSRGKSFGHSQPFTSYSKFPKGLY